MKKYTVYKHVTPSNKVYIGITSQPINRRWRNGKGYSTNKHFYRAILKYGWDNIQHIILFTNLDVNKAKQIEISLIREYNSTDPKYGYNITKGGDTRVVTDKTRKKLSKALKGRVVTEEQRLHYKEAAARRPKRTTLIDEWKRNISKSLIGNKRAVGNKSNCKPVVQISLDWEIVNYFIFGAKEAAKIIGCSSSGINRACVENKLADTSDTKYKGIYKGFRWFYFEN